MTRRRSAVLAGFSVAAIAVTLIVAHPNPVPQVRAVGTLQPATRPTRVESDPSTVPAPPTGPVVPVATTVPANGSAPVWLSVPRIGVHAEVVPVGLVAGTNGIAVPPIADVGWYQLGPEPGNPGSAVMVGHVDGGGRTGVFWKLRYLVPGDTITVGFADGTTRRFEVAGRAEVAKSALPADLFSRQGSARLALITCGGAFDYGTGHYVDNVVVVAVAD